MARLPALVAVTAAGLLALSACEWSNSEAQPRATSTAVIETSVTLAANDPIVIGVSAALSGDQMNLGVDIADAAELAAMDFGGSIKGHPIQVMRLDDGCTDPEKAVSVARSFIRQTGIAGVIGPMCTTGGQAANSVYEAAAIPHISPSTTRSEISGQHERYFFRTAWRDDVQSQTQVRFARDGLSAASAFIVDDGDPYGRGLADSFSEQFEARGGRVLLRERIERTTTDFSALGRQVLSAAPSIVVYEGFNPAGALIVKALRDAGYTGAFIGPDGLLSARDFLPTAGPQGEGAFLTGGASPDAAFVTRFQEKFGRLPGTPFVLQAHDATTALLKALDSSVSTDASGGAKFDRSTLAETLHAQRFDGMTGVISFDDNGDRRGETARELGLTIYRVTNGAFQPIE